jgi:ATP-dependent Clp protease ATP-binding subunit ClpX
VSEIQQQAFNHIKEDTMRKTLLSTTSLVLISSIFNCEILANLKEITTEGTILHSLSTEELRAEPQKEDTSWLRKVTGLWRSKTLLETSFDDFLKKISIQNTVNITPQEAKQIMLQLKNMPSKIRAYSILESESPEESEKELLAKLREISRASPFILHGGLEAVAQGHTGAGVHLFVLEDKTYIKEMKDIKGVHDVATCDDPYATHTIDVFGLAAQGLTSEKFNISPDDYRPLGDSDHETQKSPFRIINASFGSASLLEPSPAIITTASSDLGMVVESIGNKNVSLDKEEDDPDRSPDQNFLLKLDDKYLNKLILAISIDATGEKSSFSNTPGESKLQKRSLCAIGGDVSTLRGNGSVGGTSFSAPIISNAAAILKGAFPQFNEYEISDLLLGSASRSWDIFDPSTRSYTHIVEHSSELRKKHEDKQGVVHEYKLFNDIQAKYGQGILNLQNALRLAQLKVENPSLSIDQLRKKEKLLPFKNPLMDAYFQAVTSPFSRTILDEEGHHTKTDYKADKTIEHVSIWREDTPGKKIPHSENFYKNGKKSFSFKFTGSGNLTSLETYTSSGKIDEYVGSPERDYRYALLEKYLQAGKNTAEEKVLEFVPLYKPSEIVQRLDQVVVGQAEAKTQGGLELVKHMDRMRDVKTTGKTEIESGHFWFIGPSGVGKTYLAQELAKIANVPFLIVDASQFGKYNEPSKMLLPLVGKPNAEFSIVLIDELDKTANDKDAQSKLLTILQGAEKQQFGVATHNMLFIAAGSFNLNNYCRSLMSESKTITEADLYQAGIIPELLGRMGEIIQLQQLQKADYMRLLMDVRDAPLKRIISNFSRKGVNITIDTPVIECFATMLEKYPSETNVRGLRKLVRRAFRDLELKLYNEELDKDKPIHIDDIGFFARLVPGVFEDDLYRFKSRSTE